MKALILLASAAALGFAGPALAKPGHGHGHEPAMAGRGCPPGLAKKAVPCMPPGQAKKLFGVGQRVPRGYDGLLGYNRLPYNLRSYYGQQLDPRSRYIYDQNYIYRVDPRTMLVQQILSALIR
ncbi:MAG TPA: hypothetical protein VFI88_02000 [Sphingomicrobium sp.]|jgi:hypothetical protein|nr:hypothetical protein [Sphingomicrobium sp.]